MPGPLGIPGTGTGLPPHWEDQSYFSEPEFDSEYQHQHIHKSKVTSFSLLDVCKQSSLVLPKYLNIAVLRLRSDQFFRIEILAALSEQVSAEFFRSKISSNMACLARVCDKLRVRLSFTVWRNSLEKLWAGQVWPKSEFDSCVIISSIHWTSQQYTRQILWLAETIVEERDEYKWEREREGEGCDLITQNWWAYNQRIVSFQRFESLDNLANC